MPIYRRYHVVTTTGMCEPNRGTRVEYRRDSPPDLYIHSFKRLHAVVPGYAQGQ
jgi:hypothetical protein